METTYHRRMIVVSLVVFVGIGLVLVSRSTITSTMATGDVTLTPVPVGTFFPGGTMVPTSSVPTDTDPLVIPTGNFFTVTPGPSPTGPTPWLYPTGTP